ncbi:MAG: molecular chaperone TorD family protein [Nitrospirota bacterium]
MEKSRGVCMDIEQFIQFERARRDCYKVLAACFYQPQKKLFLDENVFTVLGNLLTRVCPEAALFSEKMATSVVQYDEEELLVEYARLLVGPNELLAPPYGSVYLEQGRKVMGESTARVMEFYKAEGLSMNEQFQNLPDHITAEMEFMYYLAYHEVEALEKNDREKALYFLNKQEDFLRTYLDGWVAPFCEKMRQGTENEFYQALADCVSVFMTKTDRCAMPEELRENLARV